MTDLIGTWRLVRTSAHRPDGTALPPPYGPAPTGIVTFTAEGRMAAVLCDGRSDLPEGAAREFLSYCGTVTVEGDRLITRVDAASDPARLGTDQVRAVSWDGPYLVLRPPADSYQGQPRQRVLFWEKVGPG